jgi:dTDP-4-dehydrorhamnose 3,5-epimerase
MSLKDSPMVMLSAIFQYKCTETYHPEDEHGIKWNDPSVHINWQITDPIISEKDLALPSLTELGPSLLPAYRVQK